MAGSATLFIDATLDPSSAATASPDVALMVDTRERDTLITHHHGDHCDASALKAVLGESGIVVIPESVVPWADARGLRVTRFLEAARARGVRARIVEPGSWLDA